MKIETLLIGFNRYDHLCKTLIGIENDGCKSLVAFIDGPITEKDSHEQIKIINRLHKSSIKCKIVIRNYNIGLARSISEAITEILKFNDAIIVIEDDCVPLKGFFRYSEKMLNDYKKDFSIGSICGYTYPMISETNLKNPFIADRFCPWGWSTWRDRWENFNLDLSYCLSKKLEHNRPLEVLGKDIEDYCNDEKFLNNKMNIWSLSWIITQFNNNQKCIYPNKSLIQNIGFDGTGIHSVKTDLYNVKENDNKIEYDKDISYNKELSNLIKSFMEKTSKMSYLLNND